MLPKIVILDRDSTINVSALPSDQYKSPLFYILTPQHLILKPGVKEAVAIIKIHGIPVLLATKQKCISEGLITNEEVSIIHRRLERMIDLSFDDIIVEPKENTKLKLFQYYLARYPTIKPQDFALFDDSESDRTIATRLGITVYDGTNLYESVCKAFKIR